MLTTEDGTQENAELDEDAINAEAQSLFERLGVVTYDLIKEKLNGVAKLVIDAYWKRVKDSYFTEENEKTESKQEYLSQSGKYKLSVTPFTTTGWNYTQGIVESRESKRQIAEIRRNYSCFPFLFIENHENGHDYLVCGEDYQGQTVIELDTGHRRDLLSDGSEKGWGFCWADYSYNEKEKIIIVDGCCWACPYEFRLYDFSNPMTSGWPEIETAEYNDADSKLPTFNSDGTITFYQTTTSAGDDDDDDEDDEKNRVVSSTKTFKREKNKLVLINEWISDEERARRTASEKANQEREEWLSNYKSNDPLYLEMKKIVAEDSAFSSAEDGISVGITHDGWCPDFDKREQRVCRRVIDRFVTKGTVTADIEIAAETGPVKLYYWHGKTSKNLFFEHSVEGIQQALEHAKNLR